MLEDEQIVAMVRNGNTGAFADAVERYQSPIAGYLYRLTGDYEAVRDLTQDTFVQAFKSLIKTKTDILLRAWLYGIATNKALQYRRRKRILKFVSLDKYLKTDPPDRDDQADRVGEKIMVEATLLKIPEEQRVCMLLHFVEGFKYREIAKALGISEDAVRMRVTRGSQEFRRRYTGSETDEL
ncbi:MAG: RNA polymerase sigma factor [Dehalococcoidales bacterium]|nr:RNA polymerase sigma factor [Dehalococcoidales bacterium]